MPIYTPPIQRPSVGIISGAYYDARTAYGGSTGTAAALVALVHHAIPFFVTAPLTADRIGINTTIAAAAGKLLRFGIYSAHPTTKLPDALLLDAGNVAADAAAGPAEATISFTFEPFRQYYLTVISDGTPTTSVHSNTTNHFGHAGVNDGSIRSALAKTGVAFGALPATYGAHTGFTSTATPLVGVRAV